MSKQEFLPTQDEPKKIDLELDDAKSKSSEEEEAEEEEEPHTPVLRRLVEKEGNQKGIVHLICVPILLYLLLMMIRELSGKQ